MKGFRLTGVPLAVGLAWVWATTLSYAVFGFPQVSYHGVGMFVGSLTILAAFLWAPVGLVAWWQARTRVPLGTLDKVLVAINVGSVAGFLLYGAVLEFLR